MKPVLFALGPFHIYSFGVMLALGILAVIFLLQRQARRDGFPSPEQVQDMVFVALIAGLLGGRLDYFIQNGGDYAAEPLRFFAFWEGGLIFYGGVITSLAGLWIYFRAQKISFLKGLDFLIPYVPLAHAFGRLGCFLTGCCYGRACDLPWAVQFPNLPAPVHPAQLYEASYLLFLFLFLARCYRRKFFAGEVTALYFILYGAGRFAIEFYRADNPTWHFLTWNQWISLAMILAGYSLAIFLRHQGKSQHSQGR